MTSQDYRVSTIVINCRDCGNDVGAYPGLHKCPPPPAMPAMPSIPSKYQQQSSSYSPSNSNGRRPPDLDSDSLYSGARSNGGGANSYGSGNSRTPTSSSFQDRIGGGSSARTPTPTSFQERMRERDREKQQREREEREAAARAVHEDSRVDSTASTTAAATPAAGAGTTIWSRLRAAKDVINATITGEERWPDSDDSDHEGETHVGRILREYADKKEEKELAAKIAELELTPVDEPGSLSRATGASRNQYLQDDYSSRKEANSIASSTSSGEREDYYGRSLRARGEQTGSDPSERSWSPSTSSIGTNTSNNSYGSNNLNVNSSSGGNRYRSTSDVSRDDALSRLEGKSQGDKLATQVSHLGSTSPRARANSPNVGYRSQDPTPTSPNYPNSSSNQYGNQNQLSPSSAGGHHNQNYTSSPSQRSVSPNSTRRYDAPSPNVPSASSSRQQPRYGGPPAPHVPPTYPNNNNYRQQQGPPPSSRRGDPYSSRPRAPDPSQGYGRPVYDRRPPAGPPANSGNLGAYGQRQQQQQPQYQQQQQYQPRSQYQQQQHSGYGSNGNYF
ncbi:hypothetical protein BGX27_010645 [Mortierella sp. AM989]|nr:hypothetical protein BGX27_010645 [Mortierella sp. AM989]